MKYTGIGSRKAPKPALTAMTFCAQKLSELGYTLRSGGADGSDEAFEAGATRKEIYLPWKGFNDNQSSLYTISPEAEEMASWYHPGWVNLDQAARKLMARNGYQVLGEKLDDPSDFLLCWTPDGCTSAKTRTPETGGTGQAISIADAYGVQIYNFNVTDHYRAFMAWLARQAVGVG